ncbi:MAG TPA: SLC13 family permease [Thermoanaerobaculia bacterium]|nr:SLC13 family permease [Thermoanaerobaculia bacterium]
MLVVSATLAALAIVFGLVTPREVPRLFDLRLLSLFVVLIVAVECAKRSRLFDWLVARVLARVRTERALAVSAILVTGLVSALVTNDVALLLVVPFTLAFETNAPDFDAAPVVVLEILAANLLGCVTPFGNPQNLFLFTRGAFTAATFFRAQVPFAAGMAVLLLLAVPFVVPRRALPPSPEATFRVKKRLAVAAKFLLALQVAALFGLVPNAAPLVAAVPIALLLGRGLLSTDFSLVGVFSALFVVVEALRRSAFFAAVDPVSRFGASPAGFLLSGALLSQGISNVPAAILLAPSAAAAGGLAGFVGLLYGVSAGGSGTPIASLANLIGADLFLRGRRHAARRFWALFLALSFVFLILGTGLAAILLPFASRP